MYKTVFDKYILLKIIMNLKICIDNDILYHGKVHNLFHEMITKDFDHIRLQQYNE